LKLACGLVSLNIWILRIALSSSANAALSLALFVKTHHVSAF